MVNQNNHKFKQPGITQADLDENRVNSEENRSPGPEDENDGEKNKTRTGKPKLTPEQRKVYRQALRVLNKKDVPYAVGASFARHAYTSVWRHTKDLDIFVRPEHVRDALTALKEGGFNTEVRDQQWLAKAWIGEYFIDVIFGTGHGQLPINDESFKGCMEAEILGVPTTLIPIEEVIASDAYIVGRNRFDGGEIVHLIRSIRGKIDWQRIINRLGENRQLLLWHLLLFDYIYPGHSNYLPQELMVELFNEVRGRWQKGRSRKKAFRGSLLDPYYYQVDIEEWGYEDRRKNEDVVGEEGELL